jgi:hypothetical protein
MLINNNKFINSKEKWNPEYEINILFLRRKDVEYLLFQLKIKFLKFKLVESIKLNFILPNRALT